MTARTSAQCDTRSSYLKPSGAGIQGISFHGSAGLVAPKIPLDDLGGIGPLVDCRTPTSGADLCSSFILLPLNLSQLLWRGQSERVRLRFRCGRGLHVGDDVAIMLIQCGVQQHK